MENKEEWRKVFDHKNYEVSNLGNVKSLKYGKEKILKARIQTNGFLSVCLDGKNKSIHHLVAEEFMGYKIDKLTLLDHVDGNKINNRLDNLDIISSRDKKSNYKTERSSIYKGVCFLNKSSKWKASIMVDGRTVYLGSFDDEQEAHESYQEAVDRLSGGQDIIGTDRKSKCGISDIKFNRTSRMWDTFIKYKGEDILIGSFKKEDDGREAYQKAYSRVSQKLNPIEE